MAKKYYYLRRPEDYPYEQYVADQNAVNRSAAEYVIGILRPLMRFDLRSRDWTNILLALYPRIRDARYDASLLSRKFYDSERVKFTQPVVVDTFDDDVEFLDSHLRPIGTEVQAWEAHPILAESYYDPDWFEEAMRPAKTGRLTVRDAPGDLRVVSKIASVAVKEVENGGRRATMRGVQSDRLIRGWQRVEGTENVGSCGFCLMLISRGPVYTQAEYAGLDASNARALRIWEEAEQTGDDAVLNALMTRWHPNCDCKVVPVFKGANDWPGRDQWLAADKIWREATAGYDYKEALNALRRYLYANPQGQPHELLPAA